MDFWIVAVRGDEDALLELRAAFGAPVAWVDSVEVFAHQTAEVSAAARAVLRLTQAGPSVAGAFVRETEDGSSCRQRALALACCAAPGEVLLDRETWQRLAREMVFVRPRRRPGWRVPVAAVSVSPATPLREHARTNAGTLPREPVWVGRESELQSMVAAASTPGAMVVHAARGAGGGRLIAEAAARTGHSVARVPQAALTDSDAFARMIPSVAGADWLVVDPVDPASLPLLETLRTQLLPTRRLVFRVEGDDAFGLAPAERCVTLSPITDEDTHAIVRSLLGPATSERIVGPLAKRAIAAGRGSPRVAVETTRAAVQLGTLVRDGDAWALPARRALGVRAAPRDPLTARVADLPNPLVRALGVLVSAGDGARETEVLAALRAALGLAPESVLNPLVALGFAHATGERVFVPASLRGLVDRRADVVTLLGGANALEPAARAESLLRTGRPRDAAGFFAQAASAALAGGLRAAAVRYAAAAHTQASREGAPPPNVFAAVRAVAESLGPVVTIERIDGARDGAERVRALSPESLEQAAGQYAERHDDDGAARMRALAELMRGNSQRALRISTGRHTSGTSGRAQLMTALARAAAGELPLALREALGALAAARRAQETAGEAAALSLLSSLYRAAGREDESRALAEGARRLHAAGG